MDAPSEVLSINLNQILMKNSYVVPVLFLDVFTSPREMVTKNGTKIVREGNLVFASEVGGTRNIFLSAKQLDRQASINGVNKTGIEGWRALKDLVGVGRTKAQVTVEEYKTGDEFVNADKTVGKHTVDGSNTSVDALILADSVVTMKDKKAIELTMEWNKYSIPEIEAVKEAVALGVN